MEDCDVGRVRDGQALAVHLTNLWSVCHCMKARQESSALHLPPFIVQFLTGSVIHISYPSNGRHLYLR